jgi:Family of unknown function (DUF6157)
MAWQNLGAGNSAETKMPKELHTTNYRDTFISVAEDCSATSGEVPPERSGKATIAGLHYAMIKTNPTDTPPMMSFSLRPLRPVP